ncbi:MAG: hypothetical protein COW24_04605, partial [Candidatus Kerfeldbacteria bacterium CG15_BIG_FIL_POST_REV_8_21_14_020_45_12]
NLKHTSLVVYVLQKSTPILSKNRLRKIIYFYYFVNPIQFLLFQNPSQIWRGFEGLRLTGRIARSVHDG